MIQEVSSNSNAVVQCRQHTIFWDDLCDFMSNPTIASVIRIDVGKTDFVKRVQAQRSGSVEDPQFGLLSLTHELRFSLASEKRDRLYALRGLIKSTEHAPRFTVDYGPQRELVCNEFTKECLDRYRSLNVFTMMDTASYSILTAPKTSCSPQDIGKPMIPDERMIGKPIVSPERIDPSTIRQPSWTGTDSFPASNFSASGGAKARCRKKLVDPLVMVFRVMSMMRSGM